MMDIVSYVMGHIKGEIDGEKMLLLTGLHTRLQIQIQT